VSDTNITYLVGAACGVIALVVFLTLVVVPAASAYRRVWERAAVAVLSLYVLGAFVGIGVIVGALVIYEWPYIF
jgi:hypothetical protein